MYMLLSDMRLCPKGVSHGAHIFRRTPPTEINMLPLENGRLIPHDDVCLRPGACPQVKKTRA